MTMTAKPGLAKITVGNSYLYKGEKVIAVGRQSGSFELTIRYPNHKTETVVAKHFRKEASKIDDGKVA